MKVCAYLYLDTRRYIIIALSHYGTPLFWSPSLVVCCPKGVCRV